MPLAKQIVCHFHCWLTEHGVELTTLNQSHIDAFLTQLWKKPVAESTQRNYSLVLQRYLTELYVNRHISFYCEDCIATQPVELPPYALQYLLVNKTKENSRLLPLFHRWLQKNKLQLVELQPYNIDQFVKKPNRNRVKPHSQGSYRRWVLRYLSYLYEKKLLQFNPEHTPCHPKYLPKCARQFLDELTVTLKSGTVSGYRTSLRDFHQFIDKNDIPLHTCKREHICQWLKHLADRKLHTSSRRSTITDIRVYLRWLAERQPLQTPPDILIRPSDFPKLPHYLPRPLAPDIDRALQKLLTRWKTIHAKA